MSKIPNYEERDLIVRILKDGPDKEILTCLEASKEKRLANNYWHIF